MATETTQTGTRRCAAPRCTTDILRHKLVCERHWSQLAVRTRLSINMTSGLPDARRRPWRQLLSEIRRELVEQRS